MSPFDSPTRKEIALKKVALLGLLLMTVQFAHADRHVNGYTRSDGTYVDGYYRTERNDTYNDNYSTRGNYNPYTGDPGYKPRDEDYGSPHGYGQSQSQYGY
jgi:hypothetical protein